MAIRDLPVQLAVQGKFPQKKETSISVRQGRPVRRGIFQVRRETRVRYLIAQAQVAQPDQLDARVLPEQTQVQRDSRDPQGRQDPQVSQDRLEL